MAKPYFPVWGSVLDPQDPHGVKTFKDFFRSSLWLYLLCAVCVSILLHVYLMCEPSARDQKRTLDPLRQLWTIVWVMPIEPGPLQEPQVLLTAQRSPAQENAL